MLANDIPYLEAQIIKYVMRWRSKNGVEDLDKASHFLQKLRETADPPHPAVHCEQERRASAPAQWDPAVSAHRCWKCQSILPRTGDGAVGSCTCGVHNVVYLRPED